MDQNARIRGQCRNQNARLEGEINIHKNIRCKSEQVGMPDVMKSEQIRMLDAMENIWTRS